LILSASTLSQADWSKNRLLPVFVFVSNRGGVCVLLIPMIKSIFRSWMITKKKKRQNKSNLLI